MKLPIYLDYAATCPVDERVAKKMMEFLTIDGTFGNPASRSHKFGWQAEEAVDVARNQIADLIGADSREIVFTSGATESDNLAIKGAAHFYQTKGKHIITCKTEHKAVLDTCRQLEREGFEVTYLSPESDGLIDLEKFKAALRPDTILVSIMHANNEIGVLQDIKAIGELCRANKTIFHVDATQSVGKVAINLEELPVDLLSMSSHKLYGPKGIGALYVRRKPRIRLEAIIHGGGHERGMRSGTLPVHQIVGMGEAYRIAKEMLKFKPTPEKPFVLGLPTGSTPLKTYKELINLYNEGIISFENVITFNMDEYVGLSPDNEQSTLCTNIFSNSSILNQKILIFQMEWQLI